jgi:hypothetical protein
MTMMKKGAGGGTPLTAKGGWTIDRILKEDINLRVPQKDKIKSCRMFLCGDPSGK